ncbi:MAG: ABC transporter permease [Acidobacteriota bacterium]
MNQYLSDRLARRWRLFATLVVEGQRVDWKHSVVIVLVIAGMFSTPLVLGSIRERVYHAVKLEIEKENNARQIVMHPAQDSAVPLDTDLAVAIERAYEGTRVVGNHKLVVAVEGPEGSDLSTAQSWAERDPRHSWLGVEPVVDRALELDEVIVSEGLGRLLYGQDWDGLWTPEGFDGPPLTVRINDLPLLPRFGVVARRTLPGKGLYLSAAAAHGMRRYSLGFGAPELGLRAEPGLLELALPKALAESCTILVAEADTRCDAAALDRLERRFSSRQWARRAAGEGQFASVPDRRSVRVGLREVRSSASTIEVLPFQGDCQELLAPHLADGCRDAHVLPEIEASAVFSADSSEGFEVAVVASPLSVRRLLPGAAELRDRLGDALPTDDAIDLTVAEELGLTPGDPARLEVEGTAVPARIAALYTCSPEVDAEGVADPAGCSMFTDLRETTRLRDLAAARVVLQSTSPLTFVPVSESVVFDEMLIYGPQVEAIEPLVARLRQDYPGMSIQYNVTALAKLARQDTRLATLFSLTMLLAAVFVALALGALTRLDVERRQRQLAQLLILGKSRRFVRWLIVSELLLLTIVASGLAAGLTAGLCALARSLLGRDASSSNDFAVIVSSMGLDGTAFFQVAAIVFACTWLVAVVSAHRAARTDPLTLLD